MFGLRKAFNGHFRSQSTCKFYATDNHQPRHSTSIHSDPSRATQPLELRVSRHIPPKKPPTSCHHLIAEVLNRTLPTSSQVFSIKGQIQLPPLPAFRYLRPSLRRPTWLTRTPLPFSEFLITPESNQCAPARTCPSLRSLRNMKTTHSAAAGFILRTLHPRPAQVEHPPSRRRPSILHFRRNTLHSRFSRFFVSIRVNSWLPNRLLSQTVNFIDLSQIHVSKRLISRRCTGLHVNQKSFFSRRSPTDRSLIDLIDPGRPQTIDHQDQSTSDRFLKSPLILKSGPKSRNRTFPPSRSTKSTQVPATTNSDRCSRKIPPRQTHLVLYVAQQSNVLFQRQLFGVLLF